VTYKEKKAFLSSYIRAENALNSTLMEYERWKTIGTKVNQVLSAVPGSGSREDQSKVEKAAIEMASILDGIQAEIEDAKSKKAEVINAINKGPKLRHRELLRYRYICRMSNARIADMLGKDVRTIERAMRTAIFKFDP
jgi:DNA-directed RNA polymerase specialized sigma24 family protein